jgi:protein ImuA
MSTLSPLPETCGALNRRFDAATFALVAGLEEVCVSGSVGMAAALGFLAARAAFGSSPKMRLAAVAAPRFWFSERGRPYAHGLTALGLAAGRLLVIAPRTEAETLWALEETLRSGAAAFAVGAVEAASLVATRRLDLIAREAGAAVVLIRTTPARNLSAARRRWRLAPAPSAPHPHDPKASGAPRWSARLERSRDGAVGEALLEHDDETFRLHLVDGLAGHGLACGAPVAA